MSSRNFDFYCAPEEFLDRLNRAIGECELVLFSRFQRTDQIVEISAANLEASSLVLEPQWDLWVAKKLPQINGPFLCARETAIEVRPPQIDTHGKRITRATIGMRSDWVDTQAMVVHDNPDVKPLYEAVKKRFAKGVRRGQVVFIKTWGQATESARRGYYTDGALEFQGNGWLFRDMSCDVRVGTDGTEEPD